MFFCTAWKYIQQLFRDKHVITWLVSYVKFFCTAWKYIQQLIRDKHVITWLVSYVKLPVYR